jgi:endo-1,4-beta-xylanase
MIMESPSVEAEEASFKKLAAAGVKVLITEWDLSILPRPNNQTSANISDKAAYAKMLDPYRDGVPDSVMGQWNKRMTDMFAMFLRNSDAIDRVTVWGLSDGASWLNGFPIRGRRDYPLLYDRNMKPKPVVQAMIELATKAN